MMKTVVPKIGDRVELVFTDDKYTRLKSGDVGIVTGLGNEQQILVKWDKWDNGIELVLLIGRDKYKIIGVEVKNEPNIPPNYREAEMCNNCKSKEQRWFPEDDVSYGYYYDVCVRYDIKFDPTKKCSSYEPR